MSKKENQSQLKKFPDREELDRVGIQPDTKMIQILRKQIEIGIGFVENVPLAYGLDPMPYFVTRLTNFPNNLYDLIESL